MTAPRSRPPGHEPAHARPPKKGRGWRWLIEPFRAKKAGTMPAGVVLVVMLGALLVAMFLNADATLRKSNAKGTGWRNQIAHDIASISDTFHITALRRGVDDALGKNQSTNVDVGVLLAQQKQEQQQKQAGAAAQATTTTVPDATPKIPAPTPENKLRFWVGGDSLTETFGTSMQQVAASTGVMDPTLDYRVSTGLARPDYFNWPQHLVNDVLPKDNPQVMVIMFGANDGQNMVGSDGTIYKRGTQEWRDEYRRRVAATMDLMKSPTNDRLVIWVGAPVMRPGSGVHDMDQLDYIYWSEAQKRPWVKYFDSWPFFSDANMQYVSEAPNAAGVVEGLRQRDGVHLSTVGGNRLSWAVLKQIGGLVDLSAGKTDPPADQAPPPDIHQRDQIPQTVPGAE